MDGERCAGSSVELGAPAEPGTTAADRPRRRSRWPLAVAGLAAALLVGMLVDSDDEAATAAADRPAETSPSSTRAATASEPPPPATSSPSVDTSLQDAIDEAGISAALVAQLGQVAGDTGYGLTRGVALTGDDAKGFAFLQIRTCRDLASGFRTLDEVIAGDVSGGAPAGDARTMAAFLRDTFCPAVRPLAEPTPSTQPGAATPSDGTRGLMSSVGNLDATLAPASLADCAAATGQPFGEPHAYLLPGGQLLCGDFITGGVWDPHFIHLDVVFPQPVPADQALSVVTSLLPPDIRPSSTREGTNASYAPAPGGCLSVVWTSSTIATAVERVNPDWGNDTEAGVVLYSDRRTSDGSSAPFDGTVRLAAIGIGGHNVGASGAVTC